MRETLNKILFFILLFMLTFCVACGGGSGSSSGKTPGAEESNANLAAMVLSSGSLVFSPDQTTYTVDVENAASSITITATLANDEASMVINGTTAQSGQPFGPASLVVGSNNFIIVVTAANGSSTKTYTVEVKRQSSADKSNNANLAGLALSSGKLKPGFAADTTSYTAEVSLSVASVTVTPAAAGVNARISVNGSAVVSGSPSASIPLTAGSVTAITVIVTAEDEVTTKTYTINVTRLATLSQDATLSNLTISQGTLAPAFQPATLSYTAQVTFDATSITLTPTAAGVGATIKVNGNNVASGNPALAVTLVDGANTITTVVTAENGISTKTYSLVVTRLPYSDGGGGGGGGGGSSSVLATKSQVENLLYIAYAGIGYGRADSSTDEEPLYDAMAEDLGGIAGKFVLDTINNDSDKTSKLIRIVVLGSTETFTYTTASGVVSSLALDPGSDVGEYISFTATLSINFNATAYPWNSCNYYGDGGDIDLVATATGYFKASTSGLEELYLRSVTIQARNTFRAVYPMGTVTYGTYDGSFWQIAFTAYYGANDPVDTSKDPMNVKIIPVLISGQASSNIDNRDYTLSGTFSLNGNTYIFTDVTYRQWHYNFDVDGNTLVAVNGTIKTPDVSRAVNVSNATNPGSIVRNISGTWMSGLMNFAESTTAIQANFISGTCNFTGTLGPWSVAGWQDSLEP